MNIDALVPWHSNFATRSPMYAPLQPWAQHFATFNEWPGLAEYQQLLDTLPQPILTLAGQPLRIVPQDGKPHSFEEHYAPRIYLSGEIQTRLHNWHDFFQFLTWFIFPRTKAVINSIHIPKARTRIEAGVDLGKRSPIENMLSLFDEGGAVLISSDDSLLQLIRDFRWKELFWQRRDELADKLQCITFGHALYEKGLMPYLGMTANCILLKCDESLLTQPLPQQLQWLDAELAEIFEGGEMLQQPRDLRPFPILGMPNWDSNNNQESYYENTHYFRLGRGVMRQSM
jgi:hypothetical protein